MTSTSVPGGIRRAPARVAATLSALAAALFLLAAPLAQAQSLDSLRDALKGGDAPSGGGTGGGALGSLLGGGMPSLGSVGTGNITGVLGFCAKHKLATGASGVKDQLLGKLGGEKKAEADPGYREGLAGILGGKSDRKVDLSSAGGLKAQVTEKICDEVLKYGKSLI